MTFICTRCKRDVDTPGIFCPFCGAPAPQPDAEPSDPYVGKTIAEKYFVNGLLGRGGMGQVYKATHLTLDRPVALKMLSRSFQSDPSMVQRFHREARAASKLNHPNCISVLDFGQTEDGTLFIAMEYLAGRSLAKVLSDEFPLGEVRVVRIVGQMLGALAEAHAAGIIHRDLKLSNVMIESRRDDPDFVKVLDFGIAKLSEAGAGAQLTGTGIVCGTPGYMSPEQARGEELDARSDLYAVGVVLYELLSGRLPFASDTPMGFVTKHMTETPKALGELRPDLRISPALDALVMRVLSKAREDRPASAEELRELLYTCELSSAEPAPAPPGTGGSSTVVIAAVAAPPARPSQTGPRAPGTGPNIRRFDAPRSGVSPAKGAGSAAPTAVAGPPAGTVAIPATPAPAPKPSASPKTPAPPPPGRAAPPNARTARPPTPAPVTTAEAVPAETDDAPPPRARGPAPERRAAQGRNRSMIIAAGAVVLVLVGIAAYALLRSDPFAGQTSAKTGPSPAPAAEGPRLNKAGALAPSPAPAAVAVATQPAPVPAAAPVATPPPAVPSPPPPVTAPSVAPPRPVVAPVVAAPAAPPLRPRKGAGAIEVVEGMNVLKVPAAASGQGVLTITANPWAIASLDGKELGETPREARVHAGTYRIRLSHPTLGNRDATVTVAPGQRKLYNANLK